MNPHYQHQKPSLHQDKHDTAPKAKTKSSTNIFISK